MSSLWTPGGEIPVDRDRGESTPPESGDAGERHEAAGTAPPGAGQPDQAELDEMRQQLLAAPAADVIAQHVMAFYELAALHLSAESPRLGEARLAIDAIEAVLSGLEGRLGEAEEAITGAVPQLKMAFVEAKDRAGGAGGGGEPGEADPPSS